MVKVALKKTDCLHQMFKIMSLRLETCTQSCCPLINGLVSTLLLTYLLTYLPADDALGGKRVISVIHFKAKLNK